MLLPSSLEFINLCQTQVALLVQSFDVSLSAIYLSKDLPAQQQGELIPIVVYPEDPAQDMQTVSLQLPANISQPGVLFEPEQMPALLSLAPASSTRTENDDQSQERCLPSAAMAYAPSQRLVIPLIHEEMVLGLLVAARDRQTWSDTEQSQLQQMAATLAIACVLDQRSQWLIHSQYQQRALQSEQQQTLSNLLHQFRNPLTALKTLGKLLHKRFDENDTNRKVAASIVEQSDRLENMLRQFDDAIDIGDAALESIDTDQWVSAPAPAALPPSPALPLGEEELHLQPCWLRDILQPLIQSAVGRIDQKRLHLEVRIPPDLPPVQADVGALQEVCSNLFDNALKYTPAEGEVQVEVCRQLPDEGWPAQLLLISDSGPGIPPSDLTRIFEREYRGVQADTEIPGTGLGLAIAQTLIHQMQGDIRAFSPRIDRPEEEELALPGSTFMVKLPESEVKIIN